MIKYWTNILLKIRILRFVPLFIFALLPFSLYSVFVGPPSSSAGIIERELEKQYEGAQEISPDREIPLLDVEVPSETLSLPKGKKVYIEKISFSGNTIFSDCSLEELASCHVPCEMSMHEIETLLLAIKAKYAAQGYILARAYVPAQSIENKTLKVAILEGCLGEICIESNRFYSDSFVRRYFTDFQNKPVHYETLLRALLLLNENMDLNAALLLKKSSLFGCADIILKVKDSRPIHLYWDYNNYGSFITTDSRTGARFDWGNCLVYGDKFSVAEVLGFPPADLTFTDLVYNFPLNARGTRGEISYLFAYFNVGTLRDLGLKGNSHVAELKLTHAAVRKKQLDCNVYATFDYKNLFNFALDLTASVDRLRIFGAGIDLDGNDRFWGRNIGSATLYVGVPHFLGGSKAVDPRCSREGAGGRFTIFNLDYKRIQKLPKNSFFLFNFSGQGTFYKLPLAEQIYIGGFDSVRGYELAAALGDNGYFANLELRTPIPGLVDQKVPGMKKSWKEFVQLLAFVDTGGVFLNGGGEDQARTIYLTGAGPGIRVFGPWNVNFSLDVGFPITTKEKTSNPFYYFKVSVGFL
ncbi:MAG: BamA/TamA family outer membrane protein [Parachlamydiales bacterium]|nr:BamA/TamA family outer membrane protein [Parachlamydiales bacterium]